jgi:hypothetical protein
MLGVVVAGILEHLDGPLDFLSVLVTIAELFSQRDLPISDPINELFKQMTKLTESMKTGEDFQELADRVSGTIGKTMRACFYFLYVIEPLWARKSRSQAVRQQDIEFCEKNFNERWQNFAENGKSVL